MIKTCAECGMEWYVSAFNTDSPYYCPSCRAKRKAPAAQKPERKQKRNTNVRRWY